MCSCIWQTYDRLVHVVVRNIRPQRVRLSVSMDHPSWRGAEGYNSDCLSPGPLIPDQCRPQRQRSRSLRRTTDWQILTSYQSRPAWVQEPRLALVQPQMPAAALQADPDAPLPPGLTMTLTAPGTQPLEVPIPCSIFCYPSNPQRLKNSSCFS